MIDGHSKTKLTEKCSVVQLRRHDELTRRILGEPTVGTRRWKRRTSQGEDLQTRSLGPGPLRAEGASLECADKQGCWPMLPAG
jgi:predicted secreted protein